MSFRPKVNLIIRPVIRPACFRIGTRLLLFAASAVGLVHAQGHIVQPADIADLKTVEQPRISPDGRFIVYSVHTPTAAGKPRNEHVWIVATDHGATARPLLYSSGTDTSPAWSPDGRHIAFLSNRPNPLATPGSPFSFTVAPGTDRPDIPKELSRPEPPKQVPSKATISPAPEQKEIQPPPPTPPSEVVAEPTDMQLWWIPLDGGEAEPLTNLPGGIRSFKWSHDGHSLALIRTDTDSKADRDRKKDKDDREILDHDYHFDRLWILTLASHQARLLTRGDGNIDTIDWSPDDSAILSRVSRTPRLDDYWRVSKVEIFDVTTGAMRQIVEAHSGYQEPVYSHDGLRIAYSRFTPRSITDIHLIRTLATGQDVQLEDKLGGTLAEVRWLPGDHLFVNAYVGAHTEAHEVDATTLTAVPLNHLPPTALDFDLSHDGSTLSFLGETPAQPAEVSVWRRESVDVLTRTNPQIAQWSLGTEREVQWRNPKDGHTVYGVLSLPPGYTPGHPYKTVIHMHGGPEEAFTVGFNATWYNYAALLTSQGYVVLQPNYRGSAGQEIAFTEADFQDLGGGDFADVMAGVDWAIAQGYSDPSRLVIAGWSYGGFLTAWAVTHTDRFKAAMAGAPVTDQVSMATTTDISTYVNDYLGPLAGHQADYDRHSPVRFVSACHTPVLVLQGEADVRVPTSQGAEFYHSLILENREAEMVTYPREPHIFSERAHQIDSLTRELKWFDQHLPRNPNEPTP
ncbi:MAG: S9 family peptidase [Janthinobacterium lividum]